MGSCCNFNKAETLNLESQFSPEEDNIPNIQNNKFSISDDKKNITESNMKMNLWGEPKDTFLNKNNNITIDKPDIIDEVFIENDKLENSLNIELTDEKIANNLINMEKDLFDLINELRVNPKSFIAKIQLYKEKLIIEKDKDYINIDGNVFEFPDGKKCFDECINYLQKQKDLKKFEKNQSMFECKKFFVNKNVSDLTFVIIYNLIDINSPENNKIRRKCIMNEEYNKLNITISKEESENNLYSYYFSFDQ